MRLRVYVDGRPDWSDQGPSYARLPGHGGALVVAPSKPVRTPLTANQKRPDGTQRDHRAKMRSEVAAMRAERVA